MGRSYSRKKMWLETIFVSGAGGFMKRACSKLLLSHPDAQGRMPHIEKTYLCRNTGQPIRRFNEARGSGQAQDHRPERATVIQFIDDFQAAVGGGKSKRWASREGSEEGRRTEKVMALEEKGQRGGKGWGEG